MDGDSPLSSGTALSALRHRTFRIVFVGAFASNIGTWMQNVVLGAYAYDLTHSSTFVGVIIFAQLGPALLLAMVGGLIADKVDRKKFLIVLSVEQLVFSLVLAGVVRTPSPSHLLLVATVVMVGVGSAMFGPAYSAILPVLVTRRDLPGAISLNSAQMNASRVIGPVIGEVAFHFVGPAWVFTGNAATYLFVVAALMAVSLPEAPQPRDTPAGWRELTMGGITTARADRVVGRCLVTVFLFSLLALAFIGQMPVVAAHNLGIDPKSANYGLLYACFGTGALIGAISIGTVFARTSKPMIVRFCLVGYAVALTTFALLRAALPAYSVVAVVGAFYFAFITALNTALQSPTGRRRPRAGHGSVDHGLRRNGGAREPDRGTGGVSRWDHRRPALRGRRGAGLGLVRRREGAKRGGGRAQHAPRPLRSRAGGERRPRPSDP